MCTCKNIIMYVFLFLVSATLVFLLLTPRCMMRRNTVDHFQGMSSSRTLYRTSNNFEADMIARFNALSDNDDMLLMSGCYQLTPKALITMKKPDCFTRSFTLYTNTFDEVRARIVSELQDIVRKDNKGARLMDPAFVMIQQAPYMRDDAGNVITMQFNTRSYNLMPVNLMRTGATMDDTKRPLFFRAMIYLTKYTPNMQRRTHELDIKTSMLPYRSKKDQCFIACTGDTTGSYCGCANTDINESDSKSYAAKCSSTPISLSGEAVDMTKNEEADFAILYTINSRSSTIVRANVFSS